MAQQDVILTQEGLKELQEKLEHLKTVGRKETAEKIVLRRKLEAEKIADTNLNNALKDENVDFVHHTPMTILPTGALAQIDCDNKTFSILESGVI